MMIVTVALKQEPHIKFKMCITHKHNKKTHMHLHKPREMYDTSIFTLHRAHIKEIVKRKKKHCKNQLTSKLSNKQTNFNGYFIPLTDFH